MTKKRTGRPSSFREEYVEQVRKLCLLGAKDEEIANFFNVAVSTLSLWKTTHPEFSAALKEGKAAADSVVADSLFHRAKGYSHQAVKIMQYEGEPIEVPYVEHYPPDTTACIFWLKNRRPELWRDKTETKSDVTVTRVNVDRAPRETYEQWRERRERELAASVEPATGTAGGGYTH